MVWTYADVERDWLDGARIGIPASNVVAAFDTCERALGREWIDHRAYQGAKGAGPTLGVVSMGQALACLDDVMGADRLLDKIRNGDASAVAELRAIYLLRSRGNTRVELEPVVGLPGGERACDFRIQRYAEPWVYVEVTQPGVSDARARADELLSAVVEQVSAVKKPFSLEVFLRREPNEQETASLMAASLAACSSETAPETVVREALPNDLGLLILNQHPVGRFAPDNHGEQPVPRVGHLKAIVGPGEPNRQVAVRMAFADQRAERFLTSEARQLPTDKPGLIMVEMAQARGAFQSWQAVILRRFQPTIHTRVGGVCLFASGLIPTGEGVACLYETKLIPNQHAQIPLPEWIAASVEAAGEQFRLLTAARADRREA